MDQGVFDPTGIGIGNLTDRSFDFVVGLEARTYGFATGISGAGVFGYLGKGIWDDVIGTVTVFNGGGVIASYGG